MPGTLYIVATPIGNFEDITLRAIRILKEVDMILAEDTRKTVNLLNRYEIMPPLFSYHAHSFHSKKEFILNELIKGKNLALVTDAGTPGISDPGNELIDFVAQVLPPENIVPIPGASSITTAISVSGLNMNKFVFLGFFPKKKRKKLLAWVKEGDIAFAFFESPHRLLKTLLELSEYFGGGTRVMVARELTKMHETLYRGSLSDVVKNFDGKTVKGEVVVVVEAK
jgi:16S rRNA (cytidine1402-2'-O)-methyltransferase